jgi:chaperonin cofactor prefoldin
MSSRPSRRNASKTDQAKQKLEQLKQLKETKGKKRLDDIDGDEDVANVYDEVGGFFVFVFSSLVALFLIKSRAKRKLGSSFEFKKIQSKEAAFQKRRKCSLLTHSRLFFCVLTLREEQEEKMDFKLFIIFFFFFFFALATLDQYSKRLDLVFFLLLRNAHLFCLGRRRGHDHHHIYLSGHGGRVRETRREATEGKRKLCGRRGRERRVRRYGGGGRLDARESGVQRRRGRRRGR